MIPMKSSTSPSTKLQKSNCSLLLLSKLYKYFVKNLKKKERKNEGYFRKKVQFTCLRLFMASKI